MAIISLTRLYDLLSSKLDKETAENLTTFIESKISEEVDNKMQAIATRVDLTKEVSKLELQISEAKSETIKWMFIFWIGQVVATFGFILLFMKN